MTERDTRALILFVVLPIALVLMLIPFILLG